MRRGFTIVEVVVVVAIIGTLLGLLAPRWGALRDRLTVDRATREVASFYQTARYGAIMRAQPVRIDEDRAVVHRREAERLDVTLRPVDVEVGHDRLEPVLIAGEQEAAVR